MSQSARHDGSVDDRVNVITEARPSYSDEFRRRRRRYVIMMLMRLPCLVIAVALYQHPWWAALIILVSIPLPWMAVLIANDGPARKTKRTQGPVVNHERALTGPAREVVDADGADGRSSGDSGDAAGAEQERAGQR